MTGFAEFVGDEAGAITIDWTVISGGLLLLGLLVIYTIFNSDGYVNIVAESNETLGSSGPNVAVGDLSALKEGGTSGGTDDGSGGDTEPCIGVC